MSEITDKLLAGGKIAVGILGMGSGVVNGVGRCVAGLMTGRHDMILTGVREGVHHFEIGKNVIEEGFEDWSRAGN